MNKCANCGTETTDNDVHVYHQQKLIASICSERCVGAVGTFRVSFSRQTDYGNFEYDQFIGYGNRETNFRMDNATE